MGCFSLPCFIYALTNHVMQAKKDDLGTCFTPRLNCWYKRTLHWNEQADTCLSQQAVHPFTWVRLGNTASLHKWQCLHQFGIFHLLIITSIKILNYKHSKTHVKCQQNKACHCYQLLQLAWPSLLIKPRLRDFSCQKILTGNQPFVKGFLPANALANYLSFSFISTVQKMGINKAIYYHRKHCK